MIMVISPNRRHLEELARQQSRAALHVQPEPALEPEEPLTAAAEPDPAASEG